MDAHTKHKQKELCIMKKRKMRILRHYIIEGSFSILLIISLVTFMYTIFKTFLEF